MSDDRGGKAADQTDPAAPGEADDAAAGNDVAAGGTVPQGTGGAIDVDAAHDRSS